MKKICFLFLLTVLIQPAAASNFEWKTFTSLYTVNDLCYQNGIVWCATEGGLFALNFSNGEVNKWSRQNGLAGNLVTCLISEGDTLIWLGFDNGLMQKLEVQSFQFTTYFDYQENRITCFDSAGDSLFVGLDIGLSLYIKSRQEVKETYKQLGYELQTELSVRDIAILNDSIWAATDEGLASSRINNTNLLDPANWTNYFAEDGLPSSKITSLLSYDNTIFAGTDKRLSRKSGSTWNDVSTDQHFKSSGILDLDANATDLYLLAGNGVYILKNNVLERIAAGFSNGLSLAITASEVWVGTERGLRFIESGQQEWNIFLPDCPQSNVFYDLAMDNTGKLWCAGTGGFSCFDGNSWKVYNRSNVPELVSENMSAVAVDHFNNIWIGSWGGGLTVLKNDSTFEFFNAQNGYLGGIANYPDYAVISDILVDHNGAVWLLNFRSNQSLYLISVVNDTSSGEFIWTYYATQDSLLRCITEDFYGRKWIGTDNNGVFVIDDNNTPTIKNDDNFAGTLKTGDGLESNEILSLASDEEGGVWIGTALGLYYYFNSLTPNYQIPSPYIQSLFLDGFNNLWVGMDQGLSFFPENSFFAENYNVENSLLTSNNVYSFTLDNATGNLYIGTDKGLTCIRTPYAAPEEDLSNLLVYPNPFRVEKHSTVTIDNLARETAVNIYSPSGYLVKSFSRNQVEGKLITWDGRNESGEFVASGIYLIVAAVQEGETKVGKLAVIH